MEWLGYLIAAAVVGWAIFCIVRRVRKKGSGCGCGCSDCKNCTAHKK